MDTIKAVSATLISIFPSNKVEISENEDKCENILDIKEDLKSTKLMWDVTGNQYFCQSPGPFFDLLNEQVSRVCKYSKHVP